MALPTVDTSQLAKLAKIFSTETRKKILERAGKRMGVAAESVVPPYPPPSGKPLAKFYLREAADGSLYYSKFKSRAQQGKVFSLINQGKIPTQRSGTLGRSVTSAISDLTGESVTVKIGTAIAYGPLVIGDDDDQSNYHKDHWWQLTKVMAENTDTIEAAGQTALTAEVERELKS